MNTDSVYVKQILTGPMANYAYFIGLENGKEIVAIDPSWDPKALIDEAKKNGKEIKYILLTHTHFDHVMGLEELVKLTGAKVYVHFKEAKSIDLDDVESVEEGTKLNIAGIDIDCLHTPGHTEGSVCYLIGNHLFAGDTLFVDSCGRVDLPESNPDDMVKSLKRLSELNGGIIIYPGHAYGVASTSTIGEQKKTNPCFKWRAKDLL